MQDKPLSADRLGAFSDAVIAVIITVMVLELKAPEGSAFTDLVPLWPTAISYAASYLFIAVIWSIITICCIRCSNRRRG